MLSGIAALRSGSGRLTLAVSESVAAGIAVTLPECGVVLLADTEDGHIDGASITEASSDLGGADAVLVGPGLDDADETVALLRSLAGLISEDAILVLDAFALGVLPRVEELFAQFAGRLVLTPNTGEAQRLLGRDDEIGSAEVAEIAQRYGASVSCQGFVYDTDGNGWQLGTGTVGLGTSGSGDVLSGIVAGLAARGASRSQAAVWGTHVHAVAGDRLGTSIGYLASELAAEIPLVLAELD
jgi:ADP-dependent NAD(P)H-hydrate dehydratase